jgi:signal peptidase I
VFEPCRVLSASMLPTLEAGDFVAANRLAYRGASASPADGAHGNVPRRGDIVVFRSIGLTAGQPGVPELVVKRVIGLPGDRVSMRGPAPVINGWPVPYCDVGPYLYVAPDAQSGAVRGRLYVEFLDDQAYVTLHAPSVRFDDPYVVKPGEVFVLGDNRGNSSDSRTWKTGVPLGAVDGRAQWFLVGRDRSGDADLGRLLRPLDTLAGRLRIEGLDGKPMSEAIARCLANRPANTRPPGANPPSAAISTRLPGT